MQKLQQHKNEAQAAVETALQTTTTNNNIVVKDNGKIKIIPIAQLQYLEAADDYVKRKPCSILKTVYHRRNSSASTVLISSTQHLLPVLICMKKDSHLALLTTGARLPVSKAGYAKLKEVLGI